MLKTKKILFLVESTFNQRDYVRFGFEKFKLNGFEVHLWDFTPLLRRDVYDNYTPPDQVNYNYHKVIYDKSDFNKLFHELDNVIVITMIKLRNDTMFIFKKFIDRRVTFGFLDLGQIPNYHLGLFEKAFLSIRNPKLVLSKVLSQFQTLIDNDIPPNFIILGGKRVGR